MTIIVPPVLTKSLFVTTLRWTLLEYVLVSGLFHKSRLEGEGDGFGSSEGAQHYFMTLRRPQSELRALFRINLFFYLFIYILTFLPSFGFVYGGRRRQTTFNVYPRKECLSGSNEEKFCSSLNCTLLPLSRVCETQRSTFHKELVVNLCTTPWQCSRSRSLDHGDCTPKSQSPRSPTLNGPTPTVSRLWVRVRDWRGDNFT